LTLILAANPVLSAIGAYFSEMTLA